MPLSGPILQAQIKLVVERLIKEVFKVMNGWDGWCFHAEYEMFGQIIRDANYVLIKDYQIENIQPVMK